MYDILSNIVSVLIPVVKIILVGLGALLFLSFVLYLATILVHNRQQKHIKARSPVWKEQVTNILCGIILPEELRLSSRDRKYFGGMLISGFQNGGILEKERSREAYKYLRYYNHDISELKSRAWWRRAQSIERLAQMQLEEAESDVFPLLSDRRTEVRFSAIKMLATIHSTRLATVLPQVFAENSRWAYRYIVNELWAAQLPVISLQNLVTSPDRNQRKAAAVLLGANRRRQAIDVLQILAEDSVKDVRREVSRSLGRIGSPGVLSILQDMVDDPEPDVREAVAQSLGRLNDVNTLSLLDTLTNDPSFDVRLQAFYALDRFGKPGEGIIRKHQNIYPEIAREFLHKK